MAERSFFRKITFYLSAPRCVCCGVGLSIRELALCEKCQRELFVGRERDCSRCAKPLSECSCAPEYLTNHFVKRLSKTYRYLPTNENKPLSALIFALKNTGRADVVELCAEIMAKAIANVFEKPTELIFTNVPRRRASILHFGHDHAELLSRRLAKHFSAEYKPLLKSLTKREQKKLSHEERLKNVVLCPRKDIDLKGKRIIVIDDVVTTGASLGTAASVIRSLGAKDIGGSALAIAYRD